MMGTKNILIGDVFLVDIGGGFKSVGLVRARSDRKGSLVWVSLSEPSWMTDQDVPQLAAHLPELPYSKIVGDISLKNGDWPIIGKANPGRSKDDELPLFAVEVAAVGVRNELTYSPSLKLIGMRSRARDDVRLLEDGSIHTVGSLQAFLRMKVQMAGVGGDARVATPTKLPRSPAAFDLMGEDEVRDFLEDVLGESEAPWHILKDTFARCAVADFISVDLGFQVVASASVIASIIDGKPLETDLSDRTSLTLASIAKDMAASLATAAREALQRVQGDSSELMSVWLSEQSKASFIEYVLSLSRRLTG